MHRLVIILTVAICLVVTVAACSSAAQEADIEATVEAVLANKAVNQAGGPVPALSSSAAVSILRKYLVDCIDIWEDTLGRDVNWWRDLATDADSQSPWSARYLGMASREQTYTDHMPPGERWAVIGAGLEQAEGELVASPGTWLVVAGRVFATPLDGPAQLAAAEFKRPISEDNLGRFQYTIFCST